MWDIEIDLKHESKELHEVHTRDRGTTASSCMCRKVVVTDRNMGTSLAVRVAMQVASQPESGESTSRKERTHRRRRFGRRSMRSGRKVSEVGGEDVST